MGLYLAALLVSISGLVVLDARLRLFLFAAPARAAVVLVTGLVAFLLWDAGGVALGIFFEGESGLLVGLDLAPDIPVEEVFFLVLLMLSAMHAFLVAQRLVVTAGTGRTLWQRLAAQPATWDGGGRAAR